MRPSFPPAIVDVMRHVWLPITAGALLLGCEGELTVPMAQPVADAGFDQVRHVAGPEDLEIGLDGRASCDPMGDGITGADWTIVSAPSGSPELSVGDDLQASFFATEPGEYTVALVVTSGDRESEPDYMLVRVVGGEGDDVLVAPPSTDACGQPLEGA